jgi:hypothetical protein
MMRRLVLPVFRDFGLLLILFRSCSFLFFTGFSLPLGLRDPAADDLNPKACRRICIGYSIGLCQTTSVFS